MTAKRVLIAAAVLTATLVVAGVALIALWPGPPAVFGEAYDQVTIGMTRQEVEAIVPPHRDDLFEAAIGDVASIRWEGRLEEGVRRLHVHSEQALDADPVASRARFMRWPEQDANTDAMGLTVYVDKVTNKLLGTEQAWIAGREELIVLFDADGRVVEKMHMVYRVRSLWTVGALEFIEDVLDRVWPF